MTSRTSVLSRSPRSLVSWWNQYVLPSWRETIWNTSSSKKEKVHVCSHIQLGTTPSKPCSLALKIMTINKNITLPEIFLRAQPWGGVWWVYIDPLPARTFPYRLNKPLTKTLINNVIIIIFKWCKQHVSLKLLFGGFIQIFRFKLQVQNNNSFPDSRLSNRWSIETLKKMSEQSFVHGALQTNGWDWIRSDQREKKISVIKNLLKVWKKNPDFLPFFQTLSLFSRLFPGLENCWVNFKTFSRIQDSVQTLNLLLWWFIMNYKLVRPFGVLTLCIKTSDLSKALFMSSYAGSVIGLKKEVSPYTWFHKHTLQ